MVADRHLLSAYGFEVPAELIAKSPLTNRSDSKLMRVDRQTGEISHHRFSDLPNLLNATDHLVLNDTQVIKARLHGRRPSGARIEVFVDRILDETRLSVLLRPAKRIRPGDNIVLSPTDVLRVVDRTDSKAIFTVAWEGQGRIEAAIDRLGSVPLPPYLDHDLPPDHWQSRYQTIFAQHPGAVAAPTAGLHFDADLLADLAHDGLTCHYVTLHVGWGTFEPIRTADIRRHRMHPEWYNVPQKTASQLDKVRPNGRIIAVGTTAARTLETVFDGDRYRHGSGMTTVYIYPGIPVKSLDGLITNFHLPHSSLYVFVAAFSSPELMKRAYEEAIRQAYRFYSFGDAMLIV